MTRSTRFVTSFDGVRLAVTMDGPEDAPPLLTIGPWTAVIKAVELVGSDPLEPYKGRRRWISFDRRGTGRSDRDVADISQESQLRDVEAVVEALELAQFDLACYFDGAFVAIPYAARRPEMVKRLLLWQPFAVGVDYLPP